MAIFDMKRVGQALLALAISTLPLQAQEPQPAPSTTLPGDAPAQAQGKTQTPDAAPEPPAFRVTGNQSIYTPEEIEQAIAAFRTYCQPLGGEQWADLRDITARITPEYAPYRREKGWVTAIHLTATVAAKPQVIPASDRQMGPIAGRTLYFFMGGGQSPGVFVSRQVGQFLCGLKGYESGDVEFLEIPELEFLNR